MAQHKQFLKILWTKQLDVQCFNSCVLLSATLMPPCAVHPPCPQSSMLDSLTSQISAATSSLLTPGTSATPIYSNGFAAGWRSTSYGCTDCNFKVSRACK